MCSTTSMHAARPSRVQHPPSATCSTSITSTTSATCTTSTTCTPQRYRTPPRPTPLTRAIAELETPATRGGSFRGIFAPALQLGVLSPRRAHVETLPCVRRADAARPAVNTCRQAMEGTLAWDFYLQQARQQPVGPSSLPPRHWRWDGVLTEYVVAPGEHADESSTRPAILLVHGFGAFAEQWRGQMRALAASGFDVYAATFPGYGRSEKPPLRYGQDLWRDFLRDFVLEVVGRPVVVAGNSIGGFIASSLAADYPSLVNGIVLINSAGPIVPGYVPTVPEPRRPPPTVVVDAVSWALFAFLERSIARQLSRLYPSAPQRADSWLAGEIFRAACDPGALGVFRYATLPGVCSAVECVYVLTHDNNNKNIYVGVCFTCPPRARSTTCLMCRPSRCWSSKGRSTHSTTPGAVRWPLKRHAVWRTLRWSWWTPGTALSTRCPRRSTPACFDFCSASKRAYWREGTMHVFCLHTKYVEIGKL